MSSVFLVFLKECRDNFRDKRSLFFSFVYGPLLMPLLMLGPLVVMSSKNLESRTSTLSIFVEGMDTAPNLVAHLLSKNIKAEPVEGDYQAKLKALDYRLVLSISENYGENLLAGKPETLTLYYVREDSKSRNQFRRVSSVLRAYGTTIASQRLWVRGIDQSLLTPISVEEKDLSKSSPMLSTISNLVQFLVVLSLIMSVFYLAVDIIAGERERFSLEPLLSLPVSRLNILLGKYFTIVVFGLGSGILSVAHAFVWLAFLPDVFWVDAIQPDVFVFLRFVLMLVPLAILLSSLLLFVSTFSKTTKEAQTQLSLVMMVAMAPFVVMQFTSVDPDLASWIPLLGHYVFIENFLFGESFNLVVAGQLACMSLILSAFILSFTLKLFSRDELLD